MEPRVLFDEDGDNGLVFNDKYLPEILIADILCNLDCETLLNCQLVCTRWKILMEIYVWRKKAEIICCSSLHLVKDLDWPVFYTICKKQPFERNLVKNCSGQNGNTGYWEILKQGRHHWKVESPPNGVPPLPIGVWPFEGVQRCFATSHEECSRQQIIDLAWEGLTPLLLDTLQPPIVVSEWYSCGLVLEGLYECCVQLLGDKDEILDIFQFRALIMREAQNKWHHVSHVFTDYGPGLQKIVFRHTGIDIGYLTGYYGSKMTCASVRVKILKQQEPVPDSSYLPIEKPHVLPIEFRTLEDCLIHINSYEYFRRIKKKKIS